MDLHSFQAAKVEKNEWKKHSLYDVSEEIFGLDVSSCFFLDTWNAQ